MNNIIKIDKPSDRYTSLKPCSPSVSQLEVKGNGTDLLEDRFIGKRVGIVGTRNATSAGMNDARTLARAIAAHEGIVVSGMALGIDGAAHQGALDINGKTIAVLGSGVNVCYPQKHLKLSQDILEKGAIISEYDQDTQPLAWHFPIRNRIIAALSDVLVVVEGTIRGGARITADLALAMGKPICAVPGPRRNRASELPNSLIKDGAITVLDPADVLREIGYFGNDIGWETQHTIDLNPKQESLLEQLNHEPLNHYDLSKQVNLSPLAVKDLLFGLEKLGKVKLRRGKYEAT